MCASLLTAESLTLHNTPYLADITTMARLLANHGVDLALTDSPKHISSHFARSLVLSGTHVRNFTAPYEMVRTMRASVLVLGPLLARFGQAKVSLPGGCAIGSRPIDMHLSALETLGAEIDIAEGYVIAKVKQRLRGGHVHFNKVSVGATENILMAATLAEGETFISGAAREPEVVDLADCLIAMGATITGAGTSEIHVRGVNTLHAAEHSVIADRIETGTYAACAAITGGRVELVSARIDSLAPVIEKFLEAGVQIEKTERGIRVERTGELRPLTLTTQPHPGFPTDMQAQMMSLMLMAKGDSVISETIFENRFMHVPELVRMGAHITIDGHTATIHGGHALKGAEVMATDLRASVSLVIAGLAAQGDTVINRLYHLDRGYERLEEKLAACGVKVERIR